MPLYTGLCFFKELVHALFYWSPSYQRSRESRHHSHLTNEKTGTSWILLCKSFCRWKSPLVIVALCTNLKYCHYPKTRCFLVSFFIRTGRRVGQDFKWTHSALLHTDLPPSLDPDRRERNRWPTGVKVDSVDSVEARGWDCGQSETVRRWHARCNPETLSQEFSLFWRPEVSPSPSSLWNVVLLSGQWTLAWRRGEWTKPRWHSMGRQWVPGSRQHNVTPPVLPAPLYQGVQRVQRPREWALCSGRPGVWKPDPLLCAVTQPLRPLFLLHAVALQCCCWALVREFLQGRLSGI